VLSEKSFASQFPPQPVEGEKTMKIHVVKDKSGKVVATFEPAVGTGPSSTLTPVLNDKETIGELDVPDNYKENLSTIYKG
jgi:hypothetical protein